MNKLNLLIIFLVVIFLWLSCSKSQEETLPSVKIHHQIKTNQILFRIEVPDHHHAYLDSGKENNLIPIQFDWSGLIQNQILTKEPELLSKPKGEFDNEVQATVLKGSDVFIFRIPEEAVDQLKNQKVNIKVQICNEITGICYRPVVYTIQF